MMEKLNDIAQNIVATYGMTAVVLAAITLVLFLIQIVYYLTTYNRIPGFRLSSRGKKRDAEPPVSVVVPLFSEDSDYIDFGLQTLLTQEYEQYEVVVVYIGNDNSFFADLKDKKRIYGHLVPVYIRCPEHHSISTKTAINVGLKSAQYEHVVLTTPDATPASSQWISCMARGFCYSDIVLGYCGIEAQSGFRNFIFREVRLSNAIAWLSAAVRGRAYGATRHNMGFTKELYFGVRGFNYLNMNVGEDDLFVQSIATPNNVSIIAIPRATCTERTWGGWRWWLERVHRFDVTHHYYPMRAKLRRRVELLSRAAFFASAFAMMALAPRPFAIAAFVLLLVRLFVVMRTFLYTVRRLNETSLYLRHPLFDLIEPLVRLVIRLTHSQKRHERWR